MKQSIYQKLLLSLVVAAFFATFASAQVINRSQVSPEMIEMKKKARAQGLKITPVERTEKGKIERRSQQTTSSEKKATQKKLVERKLIKSDRLSLSEKARQITPPPGFKITIKEVRGKEYIQFVELPESQGVAPARVKN